MHSAATETGPFDTIAGLPLHPLAVHVPVVILPLAALGLILLVLVPRWRRSFGWLVLAGLAVGAVGAMVARQSGEALAERVGLPERHADLGGALVLVALVLLVLSAVWWLLDRRARIRGAGPSLAVTVLGVVAAIVAAGTIVLTVLVGHSGAEAVWGSSTASATNDPEGETEAEGASDTEPDEPAAVLTMAAVQENASPASCWAAVDGSVYDLTDWIDRHPGGAARIEGICGTDATADFANQHEGEARPQDELADYLLGPLQDAAAAASLTTTAQISLAASVTQPAAQPAAKKYTRAQVRKHRTPTDCWTIINRKVYNVTPWIKKHPGGAARIIGLCGKDGSAAFNGKHAGQSKPAGFLKTFQIGVLR